MVNRGHTKDDKATEKQGKHCWSSIRRLKFCKDEQSELSPWTEKRLNTSLLHGVQPMEFSTI